MSKSPHGQMHLGTKTIASGDCIALARKMPDGSNARADAQALLKNGVPWTGKAASLFGFGQTAGQEAIYTYRLGLTRVGAGQVFLHGRNLLSGTVVDRPCHRS